MMWKRFTNQKKKGGFTLLEMLAVIGVIAVLCGLVVFASVSAYQSMKLKEYDDYAKTIFLAAQSNLSELRANGGLQRLQDENVYARTALCGGDGLSGDEWALEYKWTSSRFKDYMPGEGYVNSYDLVLPSNSVEAMIRDNWVIIEYNPITGNVYSVFYCPADGLKEDIYTIYKNGKIPRDEKERKKIGLGYYCGSALPSQDLVPEKTTAEMEFANGEEGILNIDIAIPDSLTASDQTFVDGLNVKLTLTGELSGNTMELDIMRSDGDDLATATRELGDVLRIQFVMDSLADYKSFANLAAGSKGKGVSMTSFADERTFNFQLGENLTVQAEVTYSGYDTVVDIHSGILAGVNPMFDYLVPGSTPGQYVLAVSNGRNLQNLNALAPSLADVVELVVFSDDIYWNQTVAYYNNTYGIDGVYNNAAEEAPARALPYFVPIYNELLLGSGWFYGTNLQYTQDVYGDGDTVATRDFADVAGNGHMVVGLNIDSTRYAVPEKGHYYVTNGYTNADGQKIGGKSVVSYRLTGLFAYANTNISDLNVVNSFIKGLNFDGDADRTVATGSLVGAVGPNALLTNCGAYIVNDSVLVNGNYDYTAMGGPKAYNASAAQNWYGVSGEGAVGGLVGYCMSARVAGSDLTEDPANLAFVRCFAAVPVSGNMRGNGNQNYGYTNGVGGLVGVSKLGNFLSCYASGDVMANGVYVSGKTSAWSVLDLDGKVSMGVGGFIGTSHGSRFSNCFATGDVTGNAKLGAGGFVGVMCYDGGFEYICSELSVSLKQVTVFESCYCVGEVTNADGKTENFAGGMASDRAESYITTDSKLYTDYYLMYAPYWDSKKIGMLESPGNVAVPNLNNTNTGYFYLYKDCYYLDRSLNDDFVLPNKHDCASACGYSHFMNMLANHGREDTLWIFNQVVAMGNVTNEYGQSYQNAYLNKYLGLYVSYYRQLARGYDKAYWIDATEEITHPYSFTGGKYLFPLTSGMEYYGDWPTFPLSGGLAYYEYYSNGNQIHVQFDREDTGNLATAQNLKNWGAYVTSDGYAVVAPGGNVKVTLGEKTFDLSGVSTVNWNYGGKTVTLYPLTAEVMQEAAKLTEESFYVLMTITAGGETYEVYFNPNVANSQINPIMVNATEHTNPSAPAGVPGQIQIRTARHLAALSTMERFWGHAYRYIQLLDINASMYNGYGTAGSIGNATTPFLGSYMGAGGQMSISGFKTGTSGGIFGVIGSAGTLKDVKVVAATATSNGSAEYVGLVVDVNHGSLDNVDLLINGSLTLKASKGAGLLAGYSDGSMLNCDVRGEVNVTLSAESTGGVVGVLEGTASNCTVSLAGYQAEGGSGGFVGTAHDANVNNVQITLDGEIDTNGYNFGAMGYTVTGGSYRNISAVINGNAPGYAVHALSGMIDWAENAKLEGLKVTINGTVQSNYAAGLVSVLDNSSVTGCDVTINGVLDGGFFASGAVIDIRNGSSVSNTVVTISGTVSSATSDAQGFTSMVNEGAEVTGCRVLLSGGTITGNFAAGFAHYVYGEITDYCTVTGNGSINGTADAAGFALRVYGLVAAARVTPAVQQSADAYWELSNNSLTVSGGTVAGFACTVGEEGSVLNCDAICALSGSKASGFADSNQGSVNGCIANVTITGGHAFVRQNGGSVANCYGWYGDGALSNTTSVNSTGYTSCYFADIDIVEVENPTVKNVDLIDHSGKQIKMYLSDLSSSLGKLNGSTMGKWQIPGAYPGYPYSQIGSYPFPMLREHGGDWSAAQAHFFGVIYYEEYDDGSYKTHVVELSTAREGQASSSFYWNNGKMQPTSCFDSTGIIVDAGYLLFCKDGSDPFGGNLIGSPYTGSDTIKNLVNSMAGSDAYRIYTLNTTNKFAFYSLGQTVEVVPCFADAIGMTDTYQIRTPYQLSNIHTIQASFIQTRDITLSGDFNALGVEPPRGGVTLSAGQVYDGNGFKINAFAAKNVWIRTLGGTLKNLTLVVGTPNSEIIRTVNSGGKISKLNLVLQQPMTANGAVIGTTFGEVQISSVKINAAQTRGAVIRAMTAGKLQVDRIEAAVDNCAVGTLFGEISGGTVTGTSIDLSNAVLDDYLFDSLTGGTRLENFHITVKRMNHSLIGSLTGSVLGVTVDVRDAYIGADGGILTAQMPLGKDAVGNQIPIEVKNCVLTADNVYATGDSFGTVCKSMPNAAKVTGCTISVDNLVASTRSVGGVVAENAGAVEKSTIEVKIAAQDCALVGGVAGSSTGNMNDNQINVNIRYTQTQEERANAIIGGMVGLADGGTLYANRDTVSVNGSIVLVSESVKTGKRNYIVGGVVGKDNGAKRVFYTSIQVNVVIDGKWAGASDVSSNAYAVGSHGPIGMFVGYINNGYYTNCGNIASNALYQFAGQSSTTRIKATGDNWYRHGSYRSGVHRYEMSDADTLPGVGHANGFAAFEGGQTIDVFANNMGGCTYVLNGQKYQQTVDTMYCLFSGVVERNADTGARVAAFSYRYAVRRFESTLVE